MRKPYILLFSYLLFIISCKRNDEAIPPNLPKTPVLITETVTNLTLYSVTFNGRLVDSGASKPIEIGFVVDTSAAPTISKNINKFICQPDNNGRIFIDIIDVPSNIKWYLRAYATNLQGTGYGNEVVFNSLVEKVYPGNITFTSQQQIVDFGSQNYTTIGGRMFVSGSGVTDLSPLNSLVILRNGFDVSNTQLVNFKGLEKVEVIGNLLNHTTINYNPVLVDFTGLNGLKIIHGNISIHNNNALINFKGLDNLVVSHGVEFEIQQCANLRSLDGFEKLNNITGSVLIKDNPLLGNIRGLRNVIQIADRLSFINNPSLVNLDGLEKINELTGVELIGNSSLIDIKGLKNLVKVTDYISIDDNDALSDLSSFSNITTVEHIAIKNNSSVTNLEGFRNIQSIPVRLEISNNSSLINLQGLRRLKSVARIDILSNSALINLNGLDSLTTIVGNGYSITIWSNNHLQSLDGLQKLTMAQGSIQISLNAALTNFCGLKPLFVAGYNGNFWADFNANNPTQNQIISTCP